jgi:hypothetical protein
MVINIHQYPAIAHQEVLMLFQLESMIIDPFDSIPFLIPVLLFYIIELVLVLNIAKLLMAEI